MPRRSSPAGRRRRSFDRAVRHPDPRAAAVMYVYDPLGPAADRLRQEPENADDRRCSDGVQRHEKRRDIEPVEPRSEEHTSELQSQSNLVCRLLLEKKKKNKISVYLHKKKKKK